MIADLTPRHRARAFRRFLNLIGEEVPDELALHVLLDNVATHSTAGVQRWLQRYPRFRFHFTQTYSSWMNLVERCLAELTTKWFRRGRTLGCRLEQTSAPLRLAQDRRTDLWQPGRTSQPHARLRTPVTLPGGMDRQVRTAASQAPARDVAIDGARHCKHHLYSHSKKQA